MTPAVAPSRDSSTPGAKAAGDAGATGRRRGDRLFGLILAPLIALLFRLLAWTLRVRLVGREHLETAMASGRPVIFAFWHEHLIASAFFYFRTFRALFPGARAAVLVSRSRDGQKLAEVISRLGMEPIRGSSSRGAVGALIELARWLRLGVGGPGRVAALALDGPHGPRRVAKPGIALLARKTGAIILPVSFEFSRQWVFRSWDRTRLAKPWATIEYRFPFLVASGASSRMDDRELLRRLTSALSGETATDAPPGQGDREGGPKAC
jgi:lysophospholipid acyltransferase (LPLAT)-like uncharacterized protein